MRKNKNYETYKIGDSVYAMVAYEDKSAYLNVFHGVITEIVISKSDGGDLKTNYYIKDADGYSFDVDEENIGSFDDLLQKASGIWMSSKEDDGNGYGFYGVTTT